jgi:Arc/MetJ-type ribon-helix-helix transcriptional regulator
MTVTLTPAAEAMVEARLKSGRFASPDEVIEVALSALPEYSLEDLTALQDGVDEIKNEGLTPQKRRVQLNLGRVFVRG